MGETTSKEAKEIKDKVDSLKKDFADLAQSVKEEAADRLSKVRTKVIGGGEEWAKEHPAASLGILAGVAASVGFVLGLIVGGRRN